jgi:hypothetical protein
VTEGSRGGEEQRNSEGFHRGHLHGDLAALQTIKIVLKFIRGGTMI